MKTALRWMAFTLSAMMLIQSCTIYRAKTSTLNEVILSDKKVKVINDNGEKYKFRYLFAENDKVYGITSSKQTIKLLSENIIEKNIRGGSESKILVPTDQINEYHLKNSTLTTVVNIGTPTVFLLFLITIYIGNSLRDTFISIFFP